MTTSKHPPAERFSTKHAHRRRLDFDDAWAALSEHGHRVISQSLFREGHSLRGLAVMLAFNALMAGWMIDMGLATTVIFGGIFVATIYVALFTDHSDRSAVLDLARRVDRTTGLAGPRWTIEAIPDPELPALLARLAWEESPLRCDLSYIAQPIVLRRGQDVVAVTDWTHVELLGGSPTTETVRLAVGDRVWLSGGTRTRQQVPSWFHAAGYRDASMQHVVAQPGSVATLVFPTAEPHTPRPRP